MTPKSCLLLALYSILSASDLSAQTSAHQWEMKEIPFQVSEAPEQPFDLEFSATFTHSDGTEMTVPGFYNGGLEYLLRFTPPSAGEWIVSTQSSSKDLDEKQLTLTVQPAKAGAKGGIEIREDSPREFHYKNGELYYPIAFEVDWLFALDADNPDDIPRTRKLIDTATENGFNQIILNVFAYDVNWKKDPELKPKYDFGSPTSFPFGGTNQDPDHTTLNVEFFQRFDRVIEYLNEKDVAAHVMIYVWNKRVNWPEAASPEDNRYFDYVAKRYQAYPNLVWDISKEALGYGREGTGNYIAERVERLRKLDAHNRLITVHDYNFCKNNQEILDFISVQDWQTEMRSVMLNIRNEIPGKPILNIEHGGYEKGPYTVYTGSYIEPIACLERAYKTMFAGTFPTHYWQGMAWNVIIWDIDELPESERPQLQYYKHMRSLADRYPISSLLPDPRRSNSGHSLASKDNDLFLIFVPEENYSIAPWLPKELRGKKYSATWFDPLTGEFSEPVHKVLEKWNRFNNPDNGCFSILIVEIQKE
ncbi:MAG: DUF5060 domain-containing protein [Verrucomicrobiota bacterium]